MYKFFAFLNRMKYINRWSLMRSVDTENIMEHSQHVAVVAHALATIGNVYFGKKYDCNNIAVKALLHETSEVLTGDLPTPIKYFNSEIKTAYKHLEKISNDKLLTHLPKEMADFYEPLMNDDSSEEHRIVKYADKICAYIKCVEEVRMGNAEFIKAKKTIFDEIVAFDSDEVKYFMENFMGAYQLSLDELD